MLICAIISQRWRGAAGVSLERWRISRLFLLFLWRPITVLAGKKNFTVLIIREPLFPSLSLIFFNCVFGHSSRRSLVLPKKPGCAILTLIIKNCIFIDFSGKNR